eukprot:CAMPEP_0170821300 /NCGR_PEP_ID=MMETSP0733-20121128/42971_1 /TAXON_ID=186038 /ORGANISM="Fragilariopsis kerguelensis, Strain L26-C5" /LENGTH=54 /DNA_ID=CAMNT_0011183021 /DNA_START=39 /DNA_END=200 /DNA_ORIENTATION=+
MEHHHLVVSNTDDRECVSRETTTDLAILYPRLGRQGTAGISEGYHTGGYEKNRI